MFTINAGQGGCQVIFVIFVMVVGILLFFTTKCTKFPKVFVLQEFFREFRGLCGSILMNVTKALADHRIDVARTYAETRDLRIIENRLTSHLLRIEAKLDITALKTAKIGE